MQLAAPQANTAHPPFETQRLILRAWEPSLDARHALDIYGDPQVAKGIGAPSPDASMRQVQVRLQRYLHTYGQKATAPGTGSWAVVQKDIGRVIGHVMLVPLPDMEEVRYTHVAEAIPGGTQTEYIEIGWHFRPASWGFGYATEAALRIAQHGFETLKLPLILAVTAPENNRSVGVMRRLGMCSDGVTTRCYGGKTLLLYRLQHQALVQAKQRWDSEYAFTQALDDMAL